MIIRYFTSNL